MQPFQSDSRYNFLYHDLSLKSATYCHMKQQCEVFMFMITILPCHESVVEYLKNNPHLGDEPVDIEDLVSIGKDAGP